MYLHFMYIIGIIWAGKVNSVVQLILQGGVCMQAQKSLTEFIPHGLLLMAIFIWWDQMNTS